MEVDRIICGDCLDVMKDMPDNSVDLVLTSPPYETLRDYQGYQFDFPCVADALYRVIKDGGVLVWIIKDKTVDGSESGNSFEQALYFKNICGFKIHDTMIYSKNGVNYPTPKRYYDTFEYMFVLTKGKIKTANLISDRQNFWVGSAGNSGTCRQQDGTKKQRAESFHKDVKTQGIRWNVWTYNTGFNLSSKEKIAFEHPAIFPEQLAFDHIRSWSNKGDLVLDPMCGSGTTCKMAKMLGRHYIGIEISEKYCEIARKRIEAAEQGITVNELEKGQKVLF